MIKVNFYLDKPKAEKSIIAMTVSLKGRGFIYLAELVETTQWNKEKQRLTVKRGQDDNERINSRLDKYLSWAKDAYHKLKDEGQPGYQDIIEVLSEKITGKVKSAQGFFDFVESFIEREKKIRSTDGKHNTIVTSYIQTKRLLIDYQEGRKVKLTYANMDLDFYADFIDYMSKTRGYTINTAGGHIKRTRKFLRLARKAKLHNYDYYEDFRKMEADVDVIALSWEEVDKIARTPFNAPELQEQRDMFVVGCYSGLRFSDFSKLKKQNFQDGFIHIQMKKRQGL